MNISDMIKKSRKDKGLTQKQLAEILNVSTITIQNYENNRRKPNIDTINQIAIALAVPLSTLLGDNATDITNSSKSRRSVFEDFVFSNPDTFKVVEFLERYDYTFKLFNDSNLINISKDSKEIAVIELYDFEEFAKPLIKVADFSQNKVDTFIDDITLLYSYHTD